MAQARLSAAFIEALDEEQRAAYGAVPEFDDRLARALAEARAAWPGVAVEDAVFAGHLGARVAALEPGQEPLAELRVADLYLACACSLGNVAALTAFERTFGPDIDAVARRFRTVHAEDVLQQIRTKLLVAEPGRPARISSYAGLGFLQNWVRISAVRMFLDALRAEKSDRELADSDGLMAVADPDDDVELAYLKQHYRGEFKEAFAEAIESLTSRQRNALRQHLIAGLTIDQVAAISGIHRATAARRVADAREALLAATRRGLLRRLRVDGAELDSIMRLIHSRLDVSIVRLLHSRGP